MERAAALPLVARARRRWAGKTAAEEAALAAALALAAGLPAWGELLVGVPVTLRVHRWAGRLGIPSLPKSTTPSSKGKQTPWIARREVMGDFRLFAPKAR